MPVILNNSVARRLIVVVMSMLLLLTSSAVASDEGELKTEIEQAKAAKEAARAEAADAAAQVDVAQAEAQEVQDALDAITEAVDSQEAHVARVKLELANARQFVKENKVRQELISSTIDEAALNAKRFAVDAYMGTSDPKEVWLENSDLSQSVRKVSYLDVVNQDRGDSFDDLRQLRADQDDATQAAKLARAEVKTLSEEVEAELQLLEERQAVQAELRIAAQARLDEWIAKQADHLEDEEEFEAIIRKKEAELDELLNPPARNGWVRPTAGKVGSGFGLRRHPILGYSRMHNGVDMSGGHGAAIVAAANGEVIHAGWYGGCGYTVVIAHGGGLTSRYCHQGEGAIQVSVGERVTAGVRIGSVGSTGLSTGPHLHFEIRINGTAVNPLDYIP